MVDFLPRHASRSKQDGCVYNKPRKTYNSTNCHIKHRKKLSPLQREHAAIIMLRKHGHRINHIAAALFRSTSYIHKVIAQTKKHGGFPNIDQRKMPSRIRLAQSVKRWFKLDFMINLWMPFIKGEEDKPP